MFLEFRKTKWMGGVVTSRTTFAEMHAKVTVCAGVLLLIPAPSMASLATLDVFTSWITLPMITWSTSSTGSCVLFIKPATSFRNRARQYSLLPTKRRGPWNTPVWVPLDKFTECRWDSGSGEGRGIHRLGASR